MPEGHVLHRAARLQSRHFVGHAPHITSPQGRFAAGAERLDGQRLTAIRAIGKHLVYDFEGVESLHIHLGLFGKFRNHKLPAPDPSPNCRLLMETDERQLHLAGPTACELLDPDDVAALEQRLGPDPILDPPDGPARFANTLGRRRSPIARALLDQAVIAGVGNVYRSELLFMLGVHPGTPAKELDDTSVERLWALTRTELQAGERLGRIVTVDPAEFGAERRRDLTRHERLYVYKRSGKPCRRCGTPIVSAEFDQRSTWWCPTCQPG